MTNKEVSVSFQLNYPLLRCQKACLVALAQRKDQDPDTQAALDGIIHLLDYIQDKIVDSGQAAERQVFGPLQ